MVLCIWEFKVANESLTNCRYEQGKKGKTKYFHALKYSVFPIHTSSLIKNEVLRGLLLIK